MSVKGNPMIALQGAAAMLPQTAVRALELEGTRNRQHGVQRRNKLRQHKAFVPFVTMWCSALLGLSVLAASNDALAYGARVVGLVELLPPLVPVDAFAHVLLASTLAMIGAAAGYIGARALQWTYGSTNADAGTMEEINQPAACLPPSAGEPDTGVAVNADRAHALVQQMNKASLILSEIKCVCSVPLPFAEKIGAEHQGISNLNQREDEQVEAEAPSSSVLERLIQPASDSGLQQAQYDTATDFQPHDMMDNAVKIAVTRTAWKNLLAAAERVEKECGDAMRLAGLAPPEWYDLLVALEVYGSQRPRSLQERLGMHQYVLSRIIDRMVRAGLVSRTACVDDGRGHMIDLTPEGRAMRANMWPVFSEALDAVFGDRIAFPDRILLANLLEPMAKPVDE